MSEMSESPNEPRDTQQKCCIVCGELIKSTAKKCIHCDSFQDLRRFLPISNTMLALVIALISVIAAVSPVIKNLFVEKNSEILVRLQDVHRESIYLMLSNLGEREGGIGKTSILYQTNEQPPRGQRMLLEKNREESFVPAGSSKQLRLSMECKNAEYAKRIQKFRDLYFHWKVNEKLSPHGVVEVEIISFIGEQTTELIELNRTSLEAFLNNSRTTCNSKFGLQ